MAGIAEMSVRTTARSLPQALSPSTLAGAMRGATQHKGSPAPRLSGG